MKFHKLAGFVLSFVTLCSCLSGCAGKETSSADSLPDSSEIIETETSAEDSIAEPVAETEPQPTEHVSPREKLSFSSGTQKDFTDVTLNHETNKIYAIPLNHFLISGDVVQKFIFEFEADGDIGSYQGGCGISVSPACKAATDPSWYQSEDFTAQADGSFVQVEWNVPPEIQNDVQADGKIQIGYWWGDVENVRLCRVTCCYSRTVEIPSDGEINIPVNQQLTENSPVSVSLADVIQSEEVPQAITAHVHADAPFQKFNAAMTLVNSEDESESPVFSLFTEDTQTSLTWVIPDDSKSSASRDSALKFEYFWSEASAVTLDSIDVYYSLGMGGKSSGNTSPNQEIQVSHQNNNAESIVKNIKVGWNLGNSLDCYNVTWDVDDFETAWSNPKTTKQMIDTVKNAGFNAVRIPVSWADHLDDEGNIDSLWLKRVQQVVDYAVDNHLYTILNMHHDDYTWLTPTKEKESEVTEKYTHIWTQIAEQFKNYDSTLLFEGLNEPRVVGSEKEWVGGTEEEREVINHLLQAFVDTVRSSGGNNAKRTLVITTEAASISEEAINGLIIPDDDNLIVSIHHYAPWKFTSYESPDVKRFTSEDKATLKQEFQTLYDKFSAQGIPVIIGEFGAENKNNSVQRAEYYQYYIQTAAEFGIPCFVWDNNVKEGEGSYGLFNRSDCSWYYPDILKAIQNAIQ